MAKNRRKRRTKARKLDRDNVPADDPQALEEAEKAVLARQEAEERARRNVRKAKRGSRGKEDGVTSKVAASLLANPTEDVSIEDLKQQYNYVLSDLRSMGILSAILFLVLIVLGFLI